MRQSRYHGHAAQADDLEFKALRQAGQHGLILHRYLINVCQSCAIKHRCTTAKERRIARLSTFLKPFSAGYEHPEKMCQRRETVEHPFGTIKARMGATHFQMKTLPRVASEMALRSGLQSHPRNQHHGHPAAHDGDQGIG